MAGQAQGSKSKGPQPEKTPEPKVGIALGAGGAKGIAHIPMLEALDELGVKPRHITGSSIGAVIGSLYASGMSAKEIKDKIAQIAITRSDTFQGVFSDKKISRWMAMIDPDFHHSGLIKSETILAELCDHQPGKAFEDLPIPLSLVATDFWKRTAVILESGPLRPAVQASMALPGLFTPVELDGRVLIDGGTVNPVPYDLLSDSCDIVIAVDINSSKSAEPATMPGYFDTLFGSIQIMQAAIMERELRAHPPDIYIQPELHGIRTLQFHRADEVYRQSQPAKEELKRRLEEKVAEWRAG